MSLLTDAALAASPASVDSTLGPASKLLSERRAPGLSNASGSALSESADQGKLKKAAADFESILLASLWKGMRGGLGDGDGSETDPAHGTLEDWGIEVMASALGRAGGLGIGKLILEHLGPQTRLHSSAT